MLILVLSDYPFMPNVRISDDPSITLNQGESSFAVYGDSIFAVCNIAERSSYPAIPFGRSIDGGASFEPNYNFRDNSTGIIWHTDPVIVVDHLGRLHMIVQFNTAYIKHYLSIDGGMTWIDTSFVTDPSTGGDVDKPWMVARGDTLYVVWQEFGGSSPGLKLARSFDGGMTWQRFRITSSTGITALDISPSGVLHLAYVSGYGIYYRKSTDKGATWTSARLLNYVSYSSGYGDRAPIPSISVYGEDVIFVSWVDDRNGTWDILGMYSYDGGSSWNGPIRINDSVAGGQCKSWVEFDPYGNLHVFYYSTGSWPTSSSSLWSVRYQVSLDSGRTWSPSIRITDTVFYGNDFMGDYHTIYADSFYIYAVWADGREGDMDLFFSKAPIGALINKESRVVRRRDKNDVFYTIDGRRFSGKGRIIIGTDGRKRIIITPIK